MLLFFSAYPTSIEARDGMMQRIVAIDSLFSGRSRTYIKVNFFSQWKLRKEEPSLHVKVYKVNFFLHFSLLIYLIIIARCIYVHSLGNALALLPFYPFVKVLTDMHGAMPEELKMQGKKLACLRYELVERYVVRQSKIIVSVSKAMSNHFRKKYKSPNLPIIEVPIFDSQEWKVGKSRKIPLIYSGGIQAWQNVDLMLQALKKAPRECLVLTGEVAAFQQKVQKNGLNEIITIKSVRKEEVYDHYVTANFGFVLRDDSVVNRVACPTKLVEYLSCGVIPIVLEPAIGDFAHYGYEYISLKDYVAGALPTASDIENMRKKNYEVIERMRLFAIGEARRLVAACCAEAEVPL